MWMGHADGIYHDFQLIGCSACLLYNARDGARSRIDNQSCRHSSLLLITSTSHLPIYNAEIAEEFRVLHTDLSTCRWLA